MSGCFIRTSTWLLFPCITCRIFGGAPASKNSSASLLAVIGSCSEGFNINVLPQAIAIGNIHKGIMAGKLNGVIPKQTPRDWM